MRLSMFICGDCETEIEATEDCDPNNILCWDCSGAEVMI